RYQLSLLFPYSTLFRSIDSIYTPIERVNYQVEKTRVGQKNDYDKLTLDVWTNGSITSSEAISLSAKILTEHLALFVDLTDEAKKDRKSTRLNSSHVSIS